jgi:hypothetical protein
MARLSADISSRSCQSPARRGQDQRAEQAAHQPSEPPHRKQWLSDMRPQLAHNRAELQVTIGGIFILPDNVVAWTEFTNGVLHAI